LGQWKHIVEERKPLDASQAAITLAMISGRNARRLKALTLQLERKALESAA
jgi:hypothetical protein